MLKASGKGSTGGFVPGEPHLQPVTDFNYGALDPVMDEEDAAHVKLERVLNAVCEWLYPRGARESTLELRVYTLLWFLRPEWLGNLSQVELAERLKVSKARLGKIINRFRNTFGFYVAGMRSDEAREKFRVNATRNAPKLAEARRRAVRGQGHHASVKVQKACQRGKKRHV